MGHRVPPLAGALDVLADVALLGEAGAFHCPGGGVVVPGVVLMNGGGFDGPEWSARVSLANLDDLDGLKIGHHMRTVFEQYVEEWQGSSTGN